MWCCSRNLLTTSPFCCFSLYSFTVRSARRVGFKYFVRKHSRNLSHEIAMFRYALKVPDGDSHSLPSRSRGFAKVRFEALNKYLGIFCLVS
jgi:hypothetical protein